MTTPAPLLAAVGLCSLTVGYWLGMGRSLLSYNAQSRSIASRRDHDSDDSDLSDYDDDAADLSDKKHTTLNPNEECKMVLLVRMDLKMEKGKIAAQCGHATLAAYKAALKQTPQLVKQWERLGQAKVALKCPDEATMKGLEAKARSLGLAARSIIDAGRTQIAPNSRTVLGIGPAPVSLVNEITGHLKLL
ncbi:related to PTH2 - aminoacyl-tRNA hydrolase [Pseudozyma flocculosa]|uniref:peptidyl-tRNA hydrolase n=2 Tax=Pseudozyma flocculosa TaxID=84751 RepID=A0A5C3EST2_9BASI|nr:related to PTH2 - aminoacyl-tRNA hydrolase [Pseudozyma flocculosa]